MAERARYYKALTGRKLYRIKTVYLKDGWLTDEKLGRMVEYVGEVGPSDGLLCSDGYIYLTSIELNAIRRISREGRVEMVVQSEQLEWPDSFSHRGDTIYVTTSKVGFANSPQPYRLFSFKKPQ